MIIPHQRLLNDCDDILEEQGPALDQYAEIELAEKVAARVYRAGGGNVTIAQACTVIQHATLLRYFCHGMN